MRSQMSCASATLHRARDDEVELDEGDPAGVAGADVVGLDRARGVRAR